MLELTMKQALGVWSELESAFFGKNGFGGHTAEIYAYRLQPLNPIAVFANPESKTAKLAKLDQAVIAGQNLAVLLGEFRAVHDCKIEIEDFSRWRNIRGGFSHRCHVTITPKVKRAAA